MNDNKRNGGVVLEPSEAGDLNSTLRCSLWNPFFDLGPAKKPSFSRLDSMEAPESW
jgi:hypothetical protein